MTNSTRCSTFPQDIEREIFETTIRSHPKSFRHIVLVARRVKTWIIPIVYETLILQGERTTHLLEKAPPESFARYVKHLSWGDRRGPDRGMNAQFQFNLLGDCSNLVDLALWDPDYFGFYMKGSAYAKLSTAFPNLKRFTGDVRVFNSRAAASSSLDKIWDCFAHPIFANLSHLHITSERHSWLYFMDWDVHLSRLTHLALYEDAVFLADHALIADVLLTILKRLPSLKVLVIFVKVSGMYCLGNWVQRCFNDPRVVVTSYPRDVVKDWESGARGGSDFWVRAEKVVSRRRDYERKWQKKSEQLLARILISATSSNKCGVFRETIEHHLDSRYAHHHN